ERILNKSGALSTDERYLVKMHATLGAQIASVLPAGARVERFIRHHHEWFDGSGYPSGLKGEEIPLGARIISAAEVYASLTMDRASGPALTTQDAMRELESVSGTQLDGMVVRTLIHALRGERAARQGK